MSLLSLHIKKQFFDEIINGTKTKEYRSLTKFYYTRFKNDPKFIKFHYQTEKNITAKVESIKVIPNMYPEGKRPQHLKTDFIYEVEFDDIDCEYNNWTNFETWRVATMVANDEYLYQVLTEARGYDSPNYLEQEFMNRDDNIKTWSVNWQQIIDM